MVTLYGLAISDNMNHHGDNKGNHGNHQSNHEEENHASQHEYNYFLDREIQAKLFALDEDRKQQDWSRVYKVITCSNYNSAPPAQSKSQRNKSKSLPKTELSAWCDERTTSGARAETGRKQDTSRQPRLSREKESVVGWKDTRMRDISYVFKHYGDCAKYIEQYRYEHTYNLGPLGREPIEITTCKIVPIRDAPTPVLTGSDKHHQPFPTRQKTRTDTPPHTNSTRPPPSSPDHPALNTAHAHATSDSPPRVNEAPSRPHSPSRVTPAQSESNILDLAHKYRFAPSAIKDAKVAQKGSPTPSRPLSRTGSAQTRNSRPDSGKVSNRSNSGKSGNGSVHLAPSLVALGPIGASVSPTAGRAPPKAPPNSKPNMEGIMTTTSKRHLNDSPMSGPIYTKVTYRSQNPGDSRSSPDKSVTSEKFPNTPKLVLAPNSKLRTLDLITTVNQPQENTSDSGFEQGFRPPTNFTVDASVMKETASILKQGTDRDQFKNLVSELSYLNINPVDETTGEVIPLDVTGLTVAFAQKYDIRELGFNQEPDVKLLGSNSRSPSRSPPGRSPRRDVSKQKSLLPNIIDGDLVNSEQTLGSSAEHMEMKATPRTLRIQLERVRDQRREKQQTTDVHKKQIKWRLSKMHKEFEKSVPSTPNTKTRKQILDQEFNRKLDKQRPKVSFKLPKDDSQRGQNKFDDDDATPHSDRIINGNDTTELPVINNGQMLDIEPTLPVYSSRPASPGLTVSTPDKATLMRRYFMDVAAREGDGILRERLRHAPDRNFKPSSATDIHHQAAAARKYMLNDEEEDVPPRRETAASTPIIRGKHSSAYQQRNARKPQRAKTFCNGKVAPTSAEPPQQEGSSHMEKLARLREIYMKQREKAEKEEESKGERVKYKPSVNVLHKMRQGADDADGVRTL